MEEVNGMIGTDSALVGKRCHVVVGGGSSGVLLCHKLLEFDDVILIDRGSEDCYSNTASVRNPSQWPAAATRFCEAQRVCTEPQNKLGGRQLFYPQGSGIGGTSNLNAMIWTAGHPAVFDNHWPEEFNSKAMSRFVTIQIFFAPIISKLITVQTQINNELLLSFPIIPIKFISCMKTFHLNIPL